MKAVNSTPNRSELSSTIDITLVIIRYLLWGTLILVVVSIASLNAMPVALHYFWGTVSLPLYLLLLAGFTLGWLMGMGINLINHIKLHIYTRRLEHRYQGIERQLTRLKRDFATNGHKHSLSTGFPSYDRYPPHREITHHAFAKDD